MIRLFATAATLAAMGSAMSAAPLTVEEAFTLFNGVTEGDFNSSQEVEGALYVGGNLTGSTMQVGFVNPGTAGTQFDELIVEGNSTIGKLNMQNGSDATIRGNASGTIELNGGSTGTRTATIGGTFTGNANQGTVVSGVADAGDPDFDPNFDDRFPEIDFAGFIAESSYLATLPGATLTLPDPNNKSFLGSDTATGLTVLNVDLSQLNGGTLFVDNRMAQTLLINVSGTSGTFAGNVNNKAAAENVIWNFFEATSIQVNTSIVGSVLAPLATMSGFGGSTEGSVIAKSINLTNGELHSRAFEGSVPMEVTSPPPPIPVPAALPLLVGALSGLVLLRRRAG